MRAALSAQVRCDSGACRCGTGRGAAPSACRDRCSATRSTLSSGVPVATASSAACAASGSTARIFSSARTMRTPNSVSNSAYIGPVPGVEPLGRQALEGRARQPEVFEDGRRAAVGQHAPHLQHRVAGAQRQRARDVGGGAQAPAVDDLALGRAFAVGVAAVGHQLQEAVLHVLLGMRGDEGALALAAHHQVFGREFVDRLAHRALAHAEARGQLDLARDRLARLPFAGLQALQDQRLDLLVERAERRRRELARSAVGEVVMGDRRRTAEVPSGRHLI